MARDLLVDATSNDPSRLTGATFEEVLDEYRARYWLEGTALATAAVTRAKAAETKKAKQEEHNATIARRLSIIASVVVFVVRMVVVEVLVRPNGPRLDWNRDHGPRRQSVGLSVKAKGWIYRTVLASLTVPDE